MKKFLVTILILLFSNLSFADVNVNNCDNLEKKSEKLSCLTKLKAKALKDIKSVAVSLSVEAASKIINKNLDSNDNKKIAEDTINNIN